MLTREMNTYIATDAEVYSLKTGWMEGEYKTIMQLQTVRPSAATPSYGLGLGWNVAHIPFDQSFFPTSHSSRLGLGLPHFHRNQKLFLVIHKTVVASSHKLQWPPLPLPLPPLLPLDLRSFILPSPISSASTTPCLNLLLSSPSPEHMLEQEGELRRLLSCSVTPLLSCHPDFMARCASLQPE